MQECETMLRNWQFQIWPKINFKAIGCANCCLITFSVCGAASWDQLCKLQNNHYDVMEKEPEWRASLQRLWSLLQTTQRKSRFQFSHLLANFMPSTSNSVHFIRQVRCALILTTMANMMVWVCGLKEFTIAIARLLIWELNVNLEQACVVWVSDVDYVVGVLLVPTSRWSGFWRLTFPNDGWHWQIFD